MFVTILLEIITALFWGIIYKNMMRISEVFFIKTEKNKKFVLKLIFRIEKSKKLWSCTLLGIIKILLAIFLILKVFS